MTLKLTIEPIPMTSWGLSLSNLMPREEWDKVRREVYQKAAYTCEICKRGDAVMNAHEVWAFDDRKKVQKLVEIQCLCRRCHQVKHFGRSKAVFKSGYVEGLISHWCRINKKTRADFNKYEAEIRTLNKKRHEKDYRVFVGRRELTQ